MSCIFQRARTAKPSENTSRGTHYKYYNARNSKYTLHLNKQREKAIKRTSTENRLLNPYARLFIKKKNHLYFIKKKIVFYS